MKTILRPSGNDSFLQDAVRDLVIVVVGILGALWIEATWQDYQDRQEEQAILVGLRSEFQTNLDDLEAQIAYWQELRTNTEDTHRFMGGPVNEGTIAGFLEARGRRNPRSGGLFFDPRFGQLTSLLNSGKLGLISNSELRALIADWPTLVADHDADESMLIGQQMGLLGELQAEYDQAWPDSRFESRAGELMMDRRFDHGLRTTYGLLSIMIREGEQILDLTDTIIALIDTELGDR